MGTLKKAIDLRPRGNMRERYKLWAAVAFVVLLGIAVLFLPAPGHLEMETARLEEANASLREQAELWRARLHREEYAAGWRQQQLGFSWRIFLQTLEGACPAGLLITSLSFTAPATVQIEGLAASLPVVGYFEQRLEEMGLLEAARPAVIEAAGSSYFFQITGKPGKGGGGDW